MTMLQMTKTHAKRLLKLADKLDTVPRKEFNMGCFWEYGYDDDGKPACKTAGCAMGWAGSMPEFKRVGLETNKECNEVRFTPTTSLDKRIFEKWKDLNTSFYYGDNDVQDFDAAECFFGLSPTETRQLFSADGDNLNATPKKVAENIRKLVSTHYPDLTEGAK